MTSAAIPIFSPGRTTTRPAVWSLLELSPRDRRPEPVGIILADVSGVTEIRTREASELEWLEEDEAEVLDALANDLLVRSREVGGTALLDMVEDVCSNFLRVSDREEIEVSGSLGLAADHLYERHVDAEVHPFVTHLPRYSLQAAATRFGEEMAVEESHSDLDWVRVSPDFRRTRRLTGDMFLAQVVGRSMEPLIPDGSICVFRANVAGSRQGKRLLIEQFGVLDHASRYTVKRYTSVKTIAEETGEWQHELIRLEPLNPEFEAFNLGPDGFRVVAEFVEVLSAP